MSLAEPLMAGDAAVGPQLAGGFYNLASVLGLRGSLDAQRNHGDLMDELPEQLAILRALYREGTLDHLVPRERLCHRLEFAGPAANEGEIAED